MYNELKQPKGVYMRKTITKSMQNDLIKIKKNNNWFNVDIIRRSGMSKKATSKVLENKAPIEVYEKTYNGVVDLIAKYK